MPSRMPVQAEPQSARFNDLTELIRSSSPDALRDMAAQSSLTEDSALTLLKRSDLTGECLITLGKNASVAKYRKVRLGIVEHLRTPRHVSIPLLRLLYTFDLMQVALKPLVAADLKKAAEQVLLSRLDTISPGEKMTLARRASGSIAAELLTENEPRIMRAALENPRLTEAVIAKTVGRPKAPAALIEAVCRHSKWSLARDVRLALLRSEKIPLGRALEFGGSLPPTLLRETLRSSRLSEATKACLLRQAKQQGLAKRSRAR